MDDFERSLPDLLSGGNRHVALEALPRPAGVRLRREKAEAGP